MMGKVLVVVLDGASFVLANTFLWHMPYAKKLFHNYHRRLMYVDDIPITPTVLCNMFTGRSSKEHGVYGFKHLRKGGEILGKCRCKFVWTLAKMRGKLVRVLNVPVEIPPVNLNVDISGTDWLDNWLPPKDRFLEAVRRYHAMVLRNVKQPFDLFITWYPIPDQAHHHFFQTISNEEQFKRFTYWYDLAFRFAWELINASRAEKWLVVSDHGLISDFETYEIEGFRQHVHIRDALAVTNSPPAPEHPREVYNWIIRNLGLG